MTESTHHKRLTVAIAVDFSHHAEYAVNWYIDAFHRSTNKIVLLHVPELFESTMMSPGVLVDLVKESDRQIQELKCRLMEKFAAIQVTPEFQRIHGGKPGEAIIDFVKKHEVGLIVTGTRGQGTLRRTVMGSVSDYIVHHSPVPILVCRSHEPQTT